MQKAASFTRSAFGHIHENIVEKKSERIEIRYQILHTHKLGAPAEERKKFTSGKIRWMMTGLWKCTIPYEIREKEAAEPSKQTEEQH